MFGFVYVCVPEPVKCPPFNSFRKISIAFGKNKHILYNEIHKDMYFKNAIIIQIGPKKCFSILYNKSMLNNVVFFFLPDHSTNQAHFS